MAVAAIPIRLRTCHRVTLNVASGFLMKLRRAFGILALGLLPGGAFAAPVPEIERLTIVGAIGPATVDYVHRGFVHAAEHSAQLVLLEIDTPGGLDTSMRAIVQEIVASRIPVAAYVAPSGARAASAGTFIVYASHVAAMAPGTNLGAASPVSIGVAGTPEKSPEGTDKQGKSVPDVHERKAMQDAAAYIRSLAQLRGRNAEWGEKAVLEAASLSASEALREHVIDLIAKDDADLIAQLDKRTVKVADGERTLDTAQAPVETLQPDWRHRLLAIITDPSIALLLMMLGIYGLFFEFAHPGYVLPGVVGAICLIVGLYALHMLPVNYAGLALIVVGIAFMIAEVYLPAYGSLGVGGVIAFVIGAILLIDTDVPGFGIPWYFTTVLAIASIAFILLVGGFALRARRRPPASGVEEWVGAEGEMLEATNAIGWATIRGETWRVRTPSPLASGQKIRVVAVRDLLLEVAPQEGA